MSDFARFIHIAAPIWFMVVGLAFTIFGSNVQSRVFGFVSVAMATAELAIALM
jgi:hypothetical protein